MRMSDQSSSDNATAFPGVNSNEPCVPKCITASALNPSCIHKYGAIYECGGATFAP